ncbi:CDP-diacylglycerol--serine O-phosphatidyltransferase [Perlabentimonas gracilis]|uniref:CDP-diacylglycerol--serine O-phosphatidyltransferase n=1 Tax=Perlabentimonas gracilis TaxID=2715279 RepID=UPI0014078AB9|nr:CDP-diacylglycerol--serine O-phosphatidyltransferase [Perlabentimonas gracilis]NHB68447.1 CDP-diacylglycerol--serine O-phosphatidyltransferase [Perlabentimonas gracilis]
MSLPNPLKHIPNTLTLANLLLGCLSIVSAFEGSLLLAAYLIIIATVFDFLDGFSARLLKAYSPMGKELDSLSDLVSFGVAPSVIVFHLLIDALGDSAAGGFTGGQALLVIPFLIALFSALRLAKFNIDTRQTTSFIGLPTPANALFIVGIVLGLNSSRSDWFGYFTNSPVAIIVMVLVLSALLVSPIPMFSLKIKRGYYKDTWRQQVLFFVSVPTIIFFRQASLSIVMLIYILLSVLTWRKTSAES